MTKSVAKTTRRRSRLPGAARSGDDAAARARERAGDPAAHPPGASVDLRVARRDDGVDNARDVGGAAAARGVAPGRDAARDHHARPGVDADALLQASSGAPGAELLRGERLATAARAGPARLLVPRAAAAGEDGVAPDRRDGRPAGGDGDRG